MMERWASSTIGETVDRLKVVAAAAYAAASRRAAPDCAAGVLAVRSCTAGRRVDARSLARALDRKLAYAALGPSG